MPDFTYNASALGAGGVIERGNVTYTVPSLGSVALAPTGGEGRTVVSNYFSEELSFSHAETRVFGRKTGNDTFTTSSYVLIKNLRVLDKLAVGEMHAVVTSERGMTGGDDHAFEVEASYDDVRVGNRKVIPHIDVVLSQLRTYEQLGELLVGRKAARDPQGLAKRFNASSPDELVRVIGQKKPVQGSLVETVEGYEPKPCAPTIFVPGLGTVRFAELMIKPGRRRLNLIRIMFGPRKNGHDGEQPIMMAMAEEGPESGPTGGSMTLGSGEGNGAPVEP
jgi:hypothetical protein